MDIYNNNIPGREVEFEHKQRRSRHGNINRKKQVRYFILPTAALIECIPLPKHVLIWGNQDLLYFFIYPGGDPYLTENLMGV